MSIFVLAPFGVLGATYAVHLRLIGKLVVDFQLVIIELFFARSKRLRRYERILIENRRFYIVFEAR